MVRTERTAATVAMKVSGGVEVLSVICRGGVWCMERTERTAATAAMRSVWRLVCHPSSS